jgi:hypothetical protein
LLLENAGEGAGAPSDSLICWLQNSRFGETALPLNFIMPHRRSFYTNPFSMKNAAKYSALLLTLLCHFFAQGAEFKVDPSGRHLLLNEKPFFWLAEATIPSGFVFRPMAGLRHANPKPMQVVVASRNGVDWRTGLRCRASIPTPFYRPHFAGDG